jgi:hypothetical protein
MAQSLRMKRLTLPSPNLMLDPTGRAICELEAADGTPVIVYMPYPGVDVPTPDEICVFIKDNIDSGAYTYDDPTCPDP